MTAQPGQTLDETATDHELAGASGKLIVSWPPPCTTGFPLALKIAQLLICPGRRRVRS
jgi:hypothetical protein